MTPKSNVKSYLQKWHSFLALFWPFYFFMHSIIDKKVIFSGTFFEHEGFLYQKLLSMYIFWQLPSLVRVCPVFWRTERQLPDPPPTSPFTCTSPTSPTQLHHISQQHLVSFTSKKFSSSPLSAPAIPTNTELTKKICTSEGVNILVSKAKVNR